jgi:HNH endonuclease
MNYILPQRDGDSTVALEADESMPPMPRARDLRRIESHIVADETTGCQVWRAGTWHGGYGVTSYSVDPERRRLVAVHRLMWECQYGPIPEGCHLHHRCGNPRCVNPSHLQPMTPSEHSKLTAGLVAQRRAAQAAAEGGAQ